MLGGDLEVNEDFTLRELINTFVLERGRDKFINTFKTIPKMSCDVVSDLEDMDCRFIMRRIKGMDNRINQGKTETYNLKMDTIPNTRVDLNEALTEFLADIIVQQFLGIEIPKKRTGYQEWRIIIHHFYNSLNPSFQHAFLMAVGESKQVLGSISPIYKFMCEYYAKTGQKNPRISDIFNLKAFEV